MRISGSNNDNFTLYNAAAKIPDTNKQTERQTEQPNDDASQSRKPAAVSARKNKQTQAEKLVEMENMYQELLRQLEASRAQGEAISKEMETRRKCMLIAMRIMSGDKVPPEDYRYLAENDAGLYGKAIIMRIQKENQKEYDRVSEDEESGGESGTDGTSGSEAAGTAETAGTVQIKGETHAEVSADSAPSSE